MELKIQGQGGVPQTGAAGTTATGSGRQERAAGKVAREFESLFIGMMLKSMRETVGKDSLTGGGRGEEVYRSLLDEEYARVLAERGGVGLAASLEKELVQPSRATAQREGSDNHDQAHPRDRTEVNHDRQ